MQLPSLILRILFLFVSQTLILAFSNNYSPSRISISFQLSSTGNADNMPTKSEKRIVFLRHGRTYMNDLIGGVHFGASSFTDIFTTEEEKSKYVDSPLTPKGVEQAQTLKSTLEQKATSDSATNQGSAFGSLLKDIDLVVVSPLTRALQTLDIGLYPLLTRNEVPIIACPLAAERLYLVSDIGKPIEELKVAFPYVDFDACIPTNGAWHFEPTEDLRRTYVEWRPSGEGQQYACLGEPQDYFDGRMRKLHQFLDQRQEETIVVVCHAGVIEWFLNETFENCELRIVNFDDLNVPV